MLKEVMIKERNAISQMIEESNNYDNIIELFSNCQGKLVFMGVGKSAHIGKKLAATFASLGIPSFFVHSTEAMHGDLGMIEPKDIAILISNSGNTQEVVQNVIPLKNNGVVTVAFTSGKESKLAKSCDYLLSYPKTNEADALNLAPTVSSTLTLVLGDAIACELSARKNFGRNDFYKFHPNGALGEMLKTEKKMAKITVIGSFVMDNVAKMEKFAQEGETVLGYSLELFPGGKGANQCVSVSRLGGDVEMIGMLGKDGNGETFKKILREEKIKSNNVFLCDKPTAVAQVQINAKGENRICVIPSANYEFGLNEIEKIDEVIKNTSLIILQLELRLDTTFEIIRRANKYGVKVLLNPAPAVKIEKEILGMIEYITPNETELSILTGLSTETDEEVLVAARELRSYGVKTVIATLGSRGALISTEGCEKIVTGYKVKAIDTVAAGDSFNGALAVALLEGKDLEQAVRFANAMGALTVTKQGAIPSLHNRNEVDNFIKNNI